MANITPFSKNMLVISLTILISFFLYSATFYPSLQSDHALNILMASDYSFPDTIYCWGQDRGGTFVPLFSQIFILGLGLSPIIAVSLTNYLLLTLGFLGYSQLFRNKVLMIPFSFVWFFPFQRFIDITSYPIGMSYSLLGISLFFILKINTNKHLVKNIRNLLNILTTGFIWLCSVWVSDLMYITLITIGIAFFLYIIFNKEKIQFNYRTAFLCYLSALSIILIVILKLKSYAKAVTGNFTSINSFEQVRKGFRVIWENIYIALFKEKPLTIIGTWLMFLIVLTTFIYIFRNIKSFIKFNDFWISLFLADFLATMLVIFTSHWVYLNGFGRWYFVAPYISFSIVIFLLLDRKGLFGMNHSRIALLLSPILILIHLSTIETILKENGEFKRKYSTVEEINKLGNIGIIGGYWQTYILSAVNPEQIKSSTHQKDDIKNPNRIYEVLNQPKIYMIRDSWMDSFPDTLIQFRCHFKKKGKPFYLADANLCEYEVNRSLVLNSDWLYSNNQNTLNADKTIQVNRAEQNGFHSIFGPKIIITKGEYIVEFYLSDVEIDSLSEDIIADVTSNSGEHTLVSSFLNAGTYNQEKGCFTLHFSTETLQKETEFRIQETKPISYTFHKIVVNRVD